MLLLIGVCVAFELVLDLADLGALGWPRLRSDVYEYGAFWPGLLHDWQPNYAIQPWLMFITYGFLHGGVTHMVFNMITLWSLGTAVIDRAGLSGFWWIYGVSMIVGAAVYGLIATTGQPMVGASGALFGLAGAIMAWIWTACPGTLASLRATWKVFAFLIGFNVVMYVMLDGGLAWQTHLGGFVAGWGVALLHRGSIAQ